ncbi:SDR family oxidoreductase [Streptodolium elevatio]|uniref:SDR family oxidoreductase n=1 Tax=Streptodolium elevatio TaxID=3157996 RepID=A0ABV3DD18_9ACTN
MEHSEAADRATDGKAPLHDRRVLVVGASSGIGRALARHAAQAGARVVLAARRAELLAEAADEAGPDAIPVTCDVLDQTSIDALAARIGDELGGLDALVYATGVDPLVRMADADADLWGRVLATNVVGASLVCRAVLPHLEESRGRAVFLSASAVGRPLPGMGPYDASKAALEEMVRAWRAEHAGMCFASAGVGPVLGTGVHAEWDRDLLGELAGVWENRGYLYDNGPGWMSVDDAAAGILNALTAPVCMHDFDVLPLPGAAAG